MESASVTRDSSSNCRRGCWGLAAINSTGIWRRSCSSSRGAAARIAASPRPMPFDWSATGCDLLRELEIGGGARRVRVVVDHGLPEAGSLADPNVAWNHGVEHKVGEVGTDLSLYVLSQTGPGVIHRHDHPGDGQ